MEWVKTTADELTVAALVECNQEETARCQYKQLTTYFISKRTAATIS